MRASDEIFFRRREIEQRLAGAVPQFRPIHVESDRGGSVNLAEFGHDLGTCLDRVEHRLDVSDGDLLGRRNLQGPDNGLARKLQLHLAADDLEPSRVLAENLSDCADAVLHRALRQHERVSDPFPQQHLREIVRR